MTRTIRLAALLVALISTPAYSALLLQGVEGPTPANFNNGGGSGFGGTLGNGSISMDVVGTDLVVAFNAGGNLDNIVGLYLDTRSGGFVDADMDDQGDGSRRVLSNLTSTQNDVFPGGVSPDFGVAFGSFGTVVFELNAGNTPNHLNFVSFTNTVGLATIPLATLGNPSQVDFFAAYASDSGYNSNESLPLSTPLNSAGNPGFGDGQFGGLNTGGTYENFNRFVITEVPEAGTLTLACIGISAVGFFRRRAK